MPTDVPTVWIVDDDVDIREGVAALLEDAGFHARTFDGAPSMLAALETESPQAFVLDDDMPRMTGVELRKQLLRIPRLARVPAILFTASPLATCPAALVLRKPAGVDLMVAILRTACSDAAKSGPLDPYHEE